MVGKEVTISGFAESVRGRGGVCFVTLRDGTGRIQAFLKRGSLDDASFEAIQSSSRESTISFTGTVATKRPPKVPEGAPPPPPEYEVTVSAAELLATAQTPLPLGVTDEVNVGLDTRLDNRHLDVRRSHVNAMFILRSKVLQYGREHLILSLIHI